MTLASFKDRVPRAWIIFLSLDFQLDFAHKDQVVVDVCSGDWVS